jgi:hypothetical protein
MIAQPPRIASVNVDVDGLYLYLRIHGRGAEVDPATHDATVFARGVPRFLDLFARVGVRGTFFVVAQDLAHPDVRAVLQDVVSAGHEVGSHTLSHPYGLTRMSDDAVRREVFQARAALQDATGTAIDGFRAPGYVLSPALLDAIAEAGHRYDSSLFPCPPYQLAKAAAIGAYALLGRPSQSVVDSPRVWFADKGPHRLRTRSGADLVELPVAVISPARLPFIGTSLILMGRAGLLACQPFLSREPFVNFECHGIDLTCHGTDGITDALLAQPDQRVPLGRKWPLFVAALEGLARTHRVETLSEVARALEAGAFEKARR